MTPSKKDAEAFFKNSLLFQASLGSKELFHSNIWAWLIEMDNDFLGVFFDGINLAELCPTASDKITVEREKEHRDVIIWLPGKKYLVIENKIKSLPDMDQLKKYSKNLSDNQLYGAVFTGIINPFGGDEIFVDGDVKINWRFVSYAKIAEGIRAVLSKSERFSRPDLASKKAQVEEYCEIIERLNEIIGEEMNNYNGELIYSGYDKLHPIRIYDIYAKMRGADFMHYIKEREAELTSLRDVGFDLGFWQSFHNGKVTLDIRYTNYVENAKSWFLIGVQIEENQYRLVAECHKKGDGGRSCDELYREMVDAGWFDDTYERETKLIFGRPTKMEPRGGKKYNSYKNREDTMTFIYQYYDVNAENRAYANLFECIRSDLSKAAEITRKRFS